MALSVGGLGNREVPLKPLPSLCDVGIGGGFNGTFHGENSMETKETSLPAWVLMSIWVTVTKAVENGHQDPLFLTDQLLKSAELLGITEVSSVQLRSDEASREQPTPAQSHPEHP